MAVAMTGAGDVRDQRWLDGRISAIEDGVGAVIDIAHNWSEGRNLARLHPGVSAAVYITEHVGILGKSVVPVLLAESNWSNRQIAAVAGVSPQTVGRMATVPNGTVEDRPAETLGADNKVRSYPPRVVQAVVIDGPASDEIDLDSGPDEGARADAYRRVLREYIAGIVRVQPPTIGDPPSLYRRRHDLERKLLAVLAEVMS